MSNKGSHNEVDFDFFDDPPGTPPGSSSKGKRSPSVSPDRAQLQSPDRSPSQSPDRRRSRSVTPRSRSYSGSSRGRSRSYSSRSRSRSRSPDSRYSDDFRDSDDSPRKDDRPKTPVKTHTAHISIGNKSKNYDSDASVDSDVTDVSPLNTPKLKIKLGNDSQFTHDKPPKSGKRRPTSAKNVDRGDMEHDDDSLNMKLLMEVLDMEKSDPKRQERLARESKVLFVPPGPKPHGKKNMSFSNDQVLTIDRENQRLMNKLMRTAHESNTLTNRPRKTYRKKPKPVMTSSALNRQREQQRIEQENMAMLRRLQTTKATKTLRRDKLLHDYQDTYIAGQSFAAAHTNTGYSDKYANTRYEHSFLMSDFTEPATVLLNSDGSKRRSRPSSASTLRSNVSTGQRPTSGKARPVSAQVRNKSAHQYDDRW